MNDSFLAELDEMIPKDTRTQKSRPQFSQHITTRGNYVSSTPESTSKSLSIPKIQISDHSESKSGRQSRTSNEPEQFLNVPSPRRPSDPKKTPKVSPKKKEVSKFKVLSNRDNVKEHKKVEKLPKECSSNSSDGSSKENDQPANPKSCSKVETSIKRPIFSEPTDITAFINVVKDLISNYTKAEGLKIMHRLGEMHGDLKSELVKQLFMQTDDLLEELQPTRDTNQLRLLVSENERLKENIMILQLRNEELQRRVQESISIKEENIKLKMKLKELTKQL